VGDAPRRASERRPDAAEAKKLGEFLAGCGAGAGDFIAADVSDRDAGWYASQGRVTWWDASNVTLSHLAFAWAKGVSEAVGLPLLWWQTPVGNLQLQATNRDNRLDYAFEHLDELAASGALGIAFGAGAGAGGKATPENDGGHLAARVRASVAAGSGGCR